MSKMIAAPAPADAAAPDTVMRGLGGGSWAGTTCLARCPLLADPARAPANAALDVGFAEPTVSGASTLERFVVGRSAAGPIREPSALRAEAGAGRLDAAAPLLLEARSLGACDGCATTGGATSPGAPVSASCGGDAAGFRASVFGALSAARGDAAASTIAAGGSGVSTAVTASTTFGAAAATVERAASTVVVTTAATLAAGAATVGGTTFGAGRVGSSGTGTVGTGTGALTTGADGNGGAGGAGLATGTGVGVAAGEGATGTLGTLGTLGGAGAGTGAAGTGGTGGS